MQERWKSIQAYEGLYEVSNHGHVKSLMRFVKGRDGSTRRLQGRMLTPRIRADGTHAVNLWRGNKYRQVPIKRLVLEAFDRPKPTGMDAANVNGDPSDNSLRNLQWQLDRRCRDSRPTNLRLVR